MKTLNTGIGRPNLLLGLLASTALADMSGEMREAIGLKKGADGLKRPGAKIGMIGDDLTVREALLAETVDLANVDDLVAKYKAPAAGVMHFRDADEHAGAETFTIGNDGIANC